MNIATGFTQAMSDGDDDTSTITSAIHTPPESVAGERVRESVAREADVIEHYQEAIATVIAANEKIIAGNEKIQKKIRAVYEDIAGTERRRVRRAGIAKLISVCCIFYFFTAKLSNTNVPPKSASIPVHTVTTTVTATATITATAAVTAQPSAFFIPGQTYMIRSISSKNIWSGSAITDLDSKVFLTTPSAQRSHWLLVEKNGWLGFMNVYSKRFLGHNIVGSLRCTAKHHNEWEMFHFQPGGPRGQLLLMLHWGRLVPVGISLNDGRAGLKMVIDGIAKEMVWEFVKV